MTNLEFIEKEIEKLEAFLELDDVLCELSDNDYKLYNDRLQKFKQIKTILEAWEVVKEELQIVFKGKNYYGEPLHRYELNVIGQNKIDTLNKALEAEDV